MRPHFCADRPISSNPNFRYQTILGAVLAICFAETLSPRAAAQCVERWRPGDPVGLIGPPAVLDMCRFGDRFVAVGAFIRAGGVDANKIASWDGHNWSEVGGGLMPDGCYAFTSTVYNNDLVVGGTFYAAGNLNVRGIVRWDGSEWHALGGDVFGESNQGGVFATAVFNGELIAAGNFSSAAGVPVNNIARWNGASWSAMSDGIAGGLPAALTVYNSNLIVGGTFTRAGGVNALRIAQWDGQSWSALGSGIDSGVIIDALAVHDDELIAGGAFSQAGGVSARNVARWADQTWSAMGDGLSGSGGSYQVLALLSRNGELFAGGAIEASGETPLNAVARWDGQRWSAVGGTEIRGWVYTLAELQGELVAGGDFRMDGQHFSNWARFGRSPNELPGDTNCDCTVDVADLITLLSNFGSTDGTPYMTGDRDGDADVDLQDLALVLGSFGAVCE